MRRHLIHATPAFRSRLHSNVTPSSPLYSFRRSLSGSLSFSGKVTVLSTTHMMLTPCTPRRFCAVNANATSEESEGGRGKGNEAASSLSSPELPGDDDAVSLNTAAANGDLELVRSLLDRGVDVNERDTEGRTPLRNAAFSCDDDGAVIRELLNCGADVHAVDECGRTPLHLAAADGNIDTIELLLGHGAAIDAKDPMTPLHHAASEGHVDAINVLLAGGADIEATDERNENCTPLGWAVFEGHEDAVKCLLQRGAKVNDPHTKSPLATAVFAFWGNTGIIELLLDHGADVNAKRADDGDSALATASQKPHAELVKLLLDRGAAIDQVNDGGQSPLHHAAQQGHIENLSMLLDRGAKVNLKDKDGRTPLSLAVAEGHSGVADLLIAHGSPAAPE